MKSKGDDLEGMELISLITSQGLTGGMLKIKAQGRED